MNIFMYNNGAQVQEILEWSIAVIICLFIITLLLLWYSKERTEKYASAPGDRQGVKGESPSQ